MDHTTMAWAERSLGVVCNNIEDMLKCQEAACYADVLQKMEVTMKALSILRELQHP